MREETETELLVRFACAALTGMLSSGDRPQWVLSKEPEEPQPTLCERFAWDAYELAEAMLAVHREAVRSNIDESDDKQRSDSETE